MNFEGQPYLVLTEQGAEIYWRAGQPVMDGGIENDIMMSIGCDSAGSFCGNPLLGKTQSTVLKSRFAAARLQPITETYASTCIQAIEYDLSWMKANGIVSRFDVNAAEDISGKLYFVIKVFSPSNEVAALLALTKNGENWRIQKTDPANRRLNG